MFTECRRSGHSVNMYPTCHWAAALEFTECRTSRHSVNRNIHGSSGVLPNSVSRTGRAHTHRRHRRVRWPPPLHHRRHRAVPHSCRHRRDGERDSGTGAPDDDPLRRRRPVLPPSLPFPRGGVGWAPAATATASTLSPPPPPPPGEGGHPPPPRDCRRRGRLLPSKLRTCSSVD